CSTKSAEALLEMMQLVVEKGTAYRLPRMYKEGGTYKLGSILPKGRTNVLAGKTGTAETGTTRGDHSWFVAVAPVENPRYAVAAMVEYAGLGAKVAGPVAVKTLLAALNRE
ncbi:MAG TPA: hypothetical protein EYP35_00840, partial [Desulfobacterales bacterium]|nr:hypothetical protein [Desulfobacterales bacterium]